jgi:hypothetical protein
MSFVASSKAEVLYVVAYVWCACAHLARGLRYHANRTYLSRKDSQL